MKYLDKLCKPVTGTTNIDIWKEIRTNVGGTNLTTQASIDLMTQEIADYTAWVAINGTVPFENWLRWLIRIGTIDYGNLPGNKINKDKVGHSYAPCPYSTQSNALRSESMLGAAPAAKTDHTDGSGTIYYLRTASQGSKWGYGCTFIGCPYYINNLQHYFYT